MNVLVIGDEHTYGYGLETGKRSYIGQFIRQFGQSGQAVTVNAYAHLSIPQLLATLSRLPLNRYDLIVLQLDVNLLQKASRRPCARLDAPVMPYVFRPQKADSRWRQWTAASRLWIRSLMQPVRTSQLDQLLDFLKSYRHSVLLLSPFPHRKPVGQWVRQRSRSVLLERAEATLFSVFDVDSVIFPREEYFLPDDQTHLSAVGHELLGLSLFDFYQTAPTIVTVQTIRREES